MDKDLKEFFIMIGFVIFLIIVLAIVTKVLSPSAEETERKLDCLESIAKKECGDRGLVYYNSYNVGFKCKEDIRVHETKYFIFLEDEMERCNNGD